jgi:anti-sigma B factor antagonist
MPAKHLEASVRQEPGGAILDLRGEINRFAQEALDAAYTEAEAREPEAILLNFEGVDYINSTGIALIVGLLARARLEAPPPGLRPLGALRRDLRDHSPLGLRGRLPGRRERPQGGVGVLMERGKGNEENLPGSLQSLRSEHEEIQRIYREERKDMPQAQVMMDVRKVNDKVSVIDVKGEVTAFAEGVLMQAYNQASDRRVRAIVLNFEGLEYMNSSGIGLLVTLLIRIKREKQRLLTYGLSEHYRTIFQITRLDDVISIYDSEEEAVRAADSM